MTVSDAARVLGEDAQNIRWRIREDGLPAEKRLRATSLHAIWLIRPDDLVAWYEGKAAKGKVPHERVAEVRRRVEEYRSARS